MDFNVLLLILFACASLCIFGLVMLGDKAWVYYQAVFTSRAESNLEKMFMFFDYKKMFFTNVGILLLIPAAIYLLSSNVFYTVIALIALLVAPKILLKILEIRRRNDIAKSLPDALAQIAGSMRSGSTFSAAIATMVEETKGPISQEFSLLIKEQKMGISLDDALENLGERVQSEDIDLVITAALIARDVGGNLAEIFERLSTMLRRKMEMEGKIKALTSQGKLQGIVVALLPFGIILALTFIEPDHIMPIFSTVLGWGFLGVIIILEILGGIMIRKIVSIDV